MNHTIQINHEELTDEKKQAIINYMKDHNFKFYLPLYHQILNSYVQGEIDITPYINKNTTNKKILQK